MVGMDANSLRAGRGLPRRCRVQVVAGLALAAAVAAAAVALGWPAGPAAHGAASAPVRQDSRAAHAPMMWVSTTADTVVPVNMSTGRALAPIGLNLPQPSFLVCMAITGNGKTIYVAAQDGRITPVSTATLTAGRPIVYDGHPSQIVLAPGGRTGYVVGYGFTPVNLVTGTFGKYVKDPAIGRLVLAPGGKTGYGLTAGPTTSVIPVNLRTDKPLRPITFRRLALQFTIMPNGKSAWVYLGGTTNTNELVKLNLKTRAVSAPIKLPDGVQQVVFGPRDATAYAFGTNEITPIDLAKRSLGTLIRLPISPRAWPDELTLAPDGRSAIVSNWIRNRGVQVVAVNLATGTARSPVYLGYKLWVAQHVTFTLDSKTAYVSIANDTPGGLPQAKIIPVSAATGKRVGPPINLHGQPLQILVTG